MCGQRGRGENDCSFESLLGRRRSPRRRDRSSKRFIPRQNSVVHGLQFRVYLFNGGPQPFAMARTQEIPLTALCCFRGSERTEIAVPPLSASRSCHSYLIAADVPGGSGRGSTSTTPCAMRTR